MQDDGAPEILSDAEFDARDLVGRLERLAPVLIAHRMAVADELGVGLRELVALELLDRLGRLPVSALAERVGLSPSSASRLVDRLEQRGLAWRVPDPLDGRHVLVAAEPDATGPRRALLDALGHDLRRLIDDDGRPDHRATAALVGDVADATVRRTRELTQDPGMRSALDSA